MRLATAEQVRRIDERAIRRLGVPGIALMETAGAAAAREAMRGWKSAARRGVLVLAGKGNNGGDGFVAARHLAARGVPVEVILVGAGQDELTRDAAVMARAWIRSGGKFYAIGARAGAARVSRDVQAAAARSGVVIDALLGTGLTASPRGAIAAAIRALTSIRRESPRLRVLALDVPSGLDATTGETAGVCVEADRTVTFGIGKPGLFSHPGARMAGRVKVSPLGWPRASLEPEVFAVSTIDRTQVTRCLPRLDREAHKGDRGRVLVIAGSDRRPGAAALVAYGAFRAGAGLLTVATTADAALGVVEVVPEAMPERLASARGEISAEAVEDVRALASRADAIVIGPGLGTGQGTAAVLEALLDSKGAPMVIDADGLTVLARAGASNPRRRCILTPHPGEMGKLMGISSAQVQAARIRNCMGAASRYGGWVVLKGDRTLVAAPGGELGVNLTGNPGLATAGAGDVLAGIVAAYLARGAAPFDAARAAVWMHGAAADQAAEEIGALGFLARDVADRVPNLIESTPKRRRRGI